MTANAQALAALRDREHPMGSTGSLLYLRDHRETLIAAMELVERVEGLADSWTSPPPEFLSQSSSGRYWLKECSDELRALLPIDTTGARALDD